MTDEFTRIDRFLAAFREAGGALDGGLVTLGPGDDCALLRPSTRPLAVTTDALVDGVHFRRRWARPDQVGHKALAVNLSDLAGMGATPAAFTCALGVPRDVTDDELEGLASGLGRLAGRFGAVLAGGNFTRASELSISITAIGELSGPALRRSVARPGQVVLVVGALGVAAAELGWVERGAVLPAGRSALLEPEPLVDEGRAAAQVAECGIDVSDGLVQDLGHVARASGVRVVVESSRVPETERFRVLAAGLDGAARLGLLLAGGEDYALAITADAEGARALERSIGAVVVGRVEAGAGVFVEGAPAGLQLAGHDHFRS